MDSCHLCGGKLVLTGNRCRNNSELEIGKCQACQLCQITEFSHISKEFYASDTYMSGSLAERREKHCTWNKNRLSKLQKYLGDLSGLKLIDLGCGSGGFIYECGNRFAEIAGFDLNQKVSDIHKNSGITCYNSLEEIPDNYDVVTLFHVIEHIPEPWNFLREVKDKFSLAKDIVIEVPNTNELLNSVFANPAYQQNHFVAEHLYYFTPKTLHKVVEKAGFEIFISSQLQRYSMANNLGWLADDQGGGQGRYPIFNDEVLNQEYEKVLIKAEIADSIFLICR